MKPFNENEKAFFKKFQHRSYRVWYVLIALMLIFIAGLIVDAFDGFYFTKESKSVFRWICGIMFFGILYMMGEFISGWIASKDKSSDPLYKRVFYLILLLLMISVVGGIYWFAYNYFLK